MTFGLLLVTIRKQLIEKHGFPENPNKPGYVIKNTVPDGTYSITYNSKEIDVLIKNQQIIKFLR
jgi:hypothetical protein